MSDAPSIWNRLRGLLGAKKPTVIAPPPAPEIRTAPQQAPSPPKRAAGPSVPAAKPAPSPVEPPAAPSPVASVSAPEVDLVLGIDLGTSCTKVVIGDPGWQDQSFAVSFGRTETDISAWFHSTRWGSETNLKMRLMDDPASPHLRDLLACYLAGVITHSWSWFESNRPADYRRRGIRWSLNVGFPGKAVDATSLSDAYRNITKVAVALASRPEPASLELAAHLRRHGAEVDPFISSPRIQIYPEIAAQLAGYVNSPHRRPGNLLLIDVGAGTLDVSTIILHGNREHDIVSFHFCEVKPLGVLRLYEARVSKLESIRPGCVKFPLDHFQNGSLPVPENLQEMVRQSFPDLADGFRRVSADVAENVVRVALSCLTRFRNSQRAVHANANFDPWGNTLRFFLTGGGCRSAFYKGQLADGPLECELAPFTRWHGEGDLRRTNRQGLVLEPLPLPEKLENFPSSLRRDFDRLSVAYGLAFGGSNLMKITTARQQ